MASGNSDRQASNRQPLPVPRSRRRGVDINRPASSAAATSVSESGRGSNVSGDSRKRSDQNSRHPLILLTGSPARRRSTRRAKASSRSSSQCDSVSCGNTASSRPRAVASNIRASSRAVSTPAVTRRAAMRFRMMRASIISASQIGGDGRHAAFVRAAQLAQRPAQADYVAASSDPPSARRCA